MYPRSCFWYRGTSAKTTLFQEPRKGGFSKGGFCRVQCHAQGNKKYARILGPAVCLALRATAKKGVYFCKPPSEKPRPSSCFLTFGNHPFCEPPNREPTAPPSSWTGRNSVSQFSGKQKTHKLKKNCRDTGQVFLGHPVGQTGVYRPVSQGLPVVYHRKTDRKWDFCRDTGQVSQGHPAVQGVFRKFM